MSNSIKELEKPGDTRTEYRIASTGCKNRYCDRCSVPMGLSVKGKLLAALSQWRNVYMVTLTYDPELFANGEEGQEEAYRYIRENRCVSRFIRGLRTRGVLDRKHYFCVTEFQKSGNVHFHILLDVAFIDWQTMVDIWGTFRPPGAGPVKEGRPPFGTVDFRIKHKATPTHAANYAAKYLTKSPEEGWPQWVLNYRGRIPRFTTSRQFWKDFGLAPPRPDKQNADGCEVEPYESTTGFECEETCFCEVCRGEVDGEAPKQSSISERLDTCGVGAYVVRISERLLPDGTVKRNVCHLGEVEGGWFRALEWCDLIDIPKAENESVPLDREHLIMKHYARVPRKLAYYAAGSCESAHHASIAEQSRSDLYDELGGIDADTF